MKKLLLIAVVCCIMMACSKDTGTAPENGAEIGYFDLWVKNTYPVEFDIILDSVLAGISASHSHLNLGNFEHGNEIFLQAIHQGRVVHQRTVNTKYWRKPSYTFYLYWQPVEPNDTTLTTD